MLFHSGSAVKKKLERQIHRVTLLCFIISTQVIHDSDEDKSDEDDNVVYR